MKFRIGLLTALLVLPGLVAADEIRSVRPSKVGMSGERLERIGPVMQKFIDEKNVAGIISLVARDGRVVHQQSYGTLDFDTGRAMREDAIFRIYSMSKPIAAVALMMLFEEGRFLLSEPVAKYLPELGEMKVFVEMGADGAVLEEPEHPMTMREVLSHTAGLGYGIFGDSAGPVESMYASADLLQNQHTLAEMVTKLSKLPLLYQPGTNWSYSIANDVQGRLVEVLTGQTFDVYLKERLFDPLDMPDTGFVVPADAVDRFTSNYMIAPDGAQLIDSPAKSDYVTGVKFFSGGGGLVSTARDYLRFAQMLANGGQLGGVRILSPRTLELMTLDHMPDGVVQQIGPNQLSGFGYGLGFGVIVDQAKAGSAMPVGSFWWGGAANTGFWVDPTERIVGVLMTQRFPGNLPLTNLLQSLTYQAIVE